MVWSSRQLMDGIVFVHIDQYQATSQFRDLNIVLYRSLKGNGGIRELYNLPHPETPAFLLQGYAPGITNISYRGGMIGENDFVQFLDTKLTIMQDGLNSVGVCGQSMFICIPDLVGLLRGNPKGYWPPAEILGWEEELRDKVLSEQLTTYVSPNIIL